jgi:uncharacterized membrane protein
MGQACEIIENRGSVLFRAVLTPRRSTTTRHLNTVILIFAVISVPTSVAFALVGAWPVSGFIGLDIVLLAAFLLYHHWAGRARETIELSQRSLVIKQNDPWGRQRSWQLDPHWLRIHLEDLDEHRNRLELRLRDRAFNVGSFLSADEKIGLADSLREKLAQVSVLQGA